MKSYLLRSPQKTGTAWPIASDVVVTAFHVVGSPELRKWYHEVGPAGGGYVLEDGEGGPPIRLRPLASDIDTDVALLEIEADPDADDPGLLKPAPLAEWDVWQDDAWSAAGFAVIGEGRTLTVGGKVRSVDPRRANRAIQLQVEEGSPGWEGASGSPVLVNGRVVGVLTDETVDAAMLHASEVESAARLLRLVDAGDVLADCKELVQRGCSGPGKLADLLARLDQERGPPGESLEQTASRLVSRALLHGAAGLFRLLWAVSGADSSQTDTAEELQQEIAYLTVEAEDRTWRSTARPKNTEHLDHPPPAPLLSAWEDFLESTRWHERVQEDLRELRRTLRRLGAGRGILERVASIDTTRDYASIRADVRDLLKSADLNVRVDERRARELEPEIRNLAHTRSHLNESTQEGAPFGVCLLLMGSLGAGKTHFLDFVSEAAAVDPRRPLVLRITRGGGMGQDPTRKIEDAIKEGLLAVTARAVQNLDELQSSIEQRRLSRESYWERIFRAGGAAGPGTAARPSGSYAEMLKRSAEEVWSDGDLGPRVILVIDDLQQWTTEEVIALDAIVCRNERLPDVYWLIALQEQAYERLPRPADRGPRFWTLYGTVGAYPRDRGDRDAREPGLPTKDGWISLDRLNHGTEAGFGVLRKQLGAERFDAALEEGKQNEIDKGVTLLRYLEQPWFAWELRRAYDLDECARKISTAEVRHVDLWENIVRQRLARIDSTLEGRSRARAYVELLALDLLPSGGTTFQDQSLREDVQRLAREVRANFEEGALEAAIRGLKEADLLLATPETPRTRLTIQIEPVWSFEAAKLLTVLADDGRDISGEVGARLSTRPTGTDDFKEGTLEFLLLQLDAEAARRPALEGLISAILRTPGAQALPITPLWLAAPKAKNDTTRQFALDLVKDRSAPGAVSPYRDRRGLFAWLTFIDRLENRVLSPAKRLEILRVDREAIAHEDLSKYYFGIVGDLLDDVEDTATLVSCMNALDGCEIYSPRFAEEVAHRAASKLFGLLDGKAESGGDAALDKDERAVTLILDYLEKSERNAPIRPAGTSRQRWSREHFREWLLQAFLVRLVGTRHPEPVHELLRKMKWYFGRPFGRAIQKQMIREANIAIGGYFHNKPDVLHKRMGAARPFLDLLDRLIKTEDPLDRENAFHIIRHTRPTYGEAAVRVDPVLHPYIRELAHDARLQENPQFQRFYEANFRPGPGASAGSHAPRKR